MNALVAKKFADAEKAIIDTLSRVGEMCVIEARTNGSYIDRTGNLRSSIGYVIARNGVDVKRNVRRSTSGTDRATGMNEVNSFIDDLLRQYSSGIILIVVAGMNYATYVESKRNVLASAHMLAERETPRLLKALGFVL